MSIAEQLSSSGYVFLDIQTYPALEPVLRVCQQPAATVKRRKRFLDSLYVSPALQAACEALQLEQHLVGYLPAPHLVSVELYRSTPNHTPFRSGQLWHLDIDGMPQVKLFLMGQDTTAANGPFTFLDAPQSAAVCHDTAYIPGKSLSDAAVPLTPMTLTGPAGTALLVDTSRCLHFGSRTQTGSRLALVCQYH